MGRAGRAGGGGGRSGGSRGGGSRSSSRGGGGGRSSISRSSSSHRSSAPPPRGGHGAPPRGGYGAPPPRGGHGAPPPPPPRRGYGAPPPPRRRGYYGRSGSSGCASIFAFIILVILILVIAGVSIFNSGSYANEGKVERAAEKYYDKNFDDRGDVFLFYIADSKKLEEESIYVVWGTDCQRYVADTYDSFIDAYDKYLNNDAGIQLADALKDYTALLSGKVERKLDDGKFIEKCYDDELKYIDSKGELSAAARELYDATGIQFYVVTREYKTVNVGFIIAAIVVIIIAISTVKKMIKKNKEKKQKEMEEQLKILNTPLEEFGSTNDIDNLAKKYDNASSSSASSGTYTAGSTATSDTASAAETTVPDSSDNVSE